MRTLRRIGIVCGLMIGLLFSACLHPPRQAEMKKLDPNQLAALIAKERNLFFLDVRDPQEIQELGTLPGYVNIPIDQLDQRLSEVPKDRTIVTA